MPNTPAPRPPEGEMHDFDSDELYPGHQLVFRSTEGTPETLYGVCECGWQQYAVALQDRTIHGVQKEHEIHVLRSELRRARERDEGTGRRLDELATKLREPLTLGDAREARLMLAVWFKARRGPLTPEATDATR